MEDFRKAMEDFRKARHVAVSVGFMLSHTKT